MSTVHGVRLSDDYAWLRAPNWQEILKDGNALPADIRAHLDCENEYTATVMRGTRALQKALLAEMRGRIQEDDTSPPAPDGPFAYFTEYREGGEHPLICRQMRDGSSRKVLLDCEKLARGKPFFDLGDSAHSPDHALLGWSVDLDGSESYTIRVRNLLSGRDRRERIERTDGSLVWTSDGSAFFYVRLDDNHRARFVMLHRLGTPASADIVLHEEASDLFFIDISESQSGAYGILNVSGHENSEEWLLDLAHPDMPPRLVAEREAELLYDCDHHGERLFIRTNADGAEDFKIVTAPLSKPARANWVDFVAYREGVMILTMLVLKDFLVRLEREDGMPRLIVHALATGTEHRIAFEEEAFDLDLSSGYEFDTTTIRFSYSSLSTPSATYDYDLVTRERRLLKRQIIPSGHDPSRYESKRIVALASDGEAIPVSILALRDRDRDQPSPCLLYAYGSYGHAMTPAFDSDILSLVDRGFIYAIAHVRGGTDKGWHWYRDGKRERKVNTFTDFIAVGDHLCAEGLTRTGLIVAQGASAGGMLMGAVANMRPDLFAGIIAEVPFVDCLNTILDADLPLTPPEWLEWGNPITDADAFRTILSYSPYDNVAANDYPAILATGGLSDPRVTYWEPAKWGGAAAGCADRRRPDAAQHKHERGPWRRVRQVRATRRNRAGLCLRDRLDRRRRDEAQALKTLSPRSKAPRNASSEG